jgi:hypothetical protein
MGFLKFNPKMPSPSQMPLEHGGAGETSEEIPLFRSGKMPQEYPVQNPSAKESLAVRGEVPVAWQGKDESMVTDKKKRA